MTTVALVPGAWHGAWCWERLSGQLTAAGHAVVTMDLPCDDVAAGCATYADVVLAAVADVDDELVLVGHSAGGLTIPLVAAARPVARLVFLSALLPLPGEPFTAQNRAEHVLMRDYKAGLETDPDGRTHWVDAEVARQTLYRGCDEQFAGGALRRLRPQAGTIYTEPSPLDDWPRVPIVDIRGSDDRIVSPDWAARAVPGRLGLESIVVDGAGHATLLARPRELAELLLAD